MAIALLLSACALTPERHVEPEEVSRLAEVSPDDGSTALSWERGNVERAEWSRQLTKLVTDNLATYDSATDIEFFCPSYKSLKGAERVQAVAELWVATAEHESSFRPGIEVIDVGEADNPETWSIGLYQVSVVDQKSFGFNTKYTVEELKTPGPNIHLAHMIMMRQLTRRGAIVVPSNPYWAVLYRGKYSKVDDIAQHVRTEVAVCASAEHR